MPLKQLDITIRTLTLIVGARGPRGRGRARRRPGGRPPVLDHRHPGRLPALFQPVPALPRAERRRHRRRQSGPPALQARLVRRRHQVHHLDRRGDRRHALVQVPARRAEQPRWPSSARASIRPARRSRSASPRAARRCSRARASAAAATCCRARASSTPPRSARSAPTRQPAEIQRYLLEPNKAMLADQPADRHHHPRRQDPDRPPCQRRHLLGAAARRRGPEAALDRQGRHQDLRPGQDLGHAQRRRQA